MKLFFLTVLSILTCQVFAGAIRGFVRDNAGKPLAYASVYVKNSKEGTTTGINGNYLLNLEPGTYTIIAQYVGYIKKEKIITITDADLALDFSLELQQSALKEVVVRPGGEDPANEIIRNAIKKRKDHLAELKNFSCEVYTKEQLQLRNFPARFMGKKVDFEDGDTSKRKILYLSESVARYSKRPPDKTKLEVVSTRVSGERNSFGISLPRIINFYENNIDAGGLNPRGFISPIADNAFNFYRYHFEGSFWEDGVEINRIKVIPKRKYEPVFSGYIMIVEGDWRIHSLQLQLLKTSQMEVLDTLGIEQLYAPLTKDAWVIRNQILYPSVKLFGFDAFGSAVTLYSKFDLEPSFAPKFFNNTVIKYQEGSNKKAADYWDSVRPLPLQVEERLDFYKKDSLELVRKSPRYQDSLDRIRNRFSVTGFLLTGQNFSKQKRRENYAIDPLIRAVSFNTVEGWVLNLSGVYTKRLDSAESRRMISISPTIRYGFSSHDFYGKLEATYGFGSLYPSRLQLEGGRYVFQYNNSDPISPFINTLASLFWKQNYLKLYAANYFKISYSKGVGSGVRFNATVQFQDRNALENSTGQTWVNKPDRSYSPNYPTDLSNQPMPDNKALELTAGIRWRPGVRYIEFPDRRIGMGSKYPVFTGSISKGIRGLMDSDADFLKWSASVNDDLNFKLGGQLQYKVSVGGFLQADHVDMPDYKNFMGNQVAWTPGYFGGFETLPYYKFSNTESFWTEWHLRHHFNGLLTNKIPGFRKLNWYLVGGANGLWLNDRRHYEEVYLGLENIFKIGQANIVWAFDQGVYQGLYFRFSISGFLSGAPD